MTGKVGRPSRNFKDIAGLYHRKDGRWTVKETGFTFTEKDEAQAIARFRKLTQNSDLIEAPIEAIFEFEEIDASTSERRIVKSRSPYKANVKLAQDAAIASRETIINSDLFWSTVRELLLKRPLLVAERTGLPKVANFQDMSDPGKSIKITDLLDSYCKNSGVGKICQHNSRRVVKEFIRLTECETLRDLTTEKLTAYRDDIKKRSDSFDTVHNGYFARIKTVVAFGLKEGISPEQIRAALDKLKVLHALTHKKGMKDPQPISVEDFHTLVAGADKTMRAALLVSMNCCMYMSEGLAIKWSEINFAKNTFVSRRNKTSVRRAATLWPETIEAIKALGRKGKSPYVFTCKTGTKYSYGVQGFRARFNRLCDAVVVTSEFSHIRDGAYSACCSAGVALQLCRAVAGHQLDGETDHYVARNPRMVKPACDAIYAEYAPLPDSKPVVRIGRPRKTPFVAQKALQAE